MAGTFLYDTSILFIMDKLPRDVNNKLVGPNKKYEPVLDDEVWITPAVYNMAFEPGYYA